uniref:NADH-ubiquinone oxidoreductase chain 1 n=1 Tax=Prionospio multibranchiata TaxID=3050093 RepID=A0AAU6QG35_9ANNE
MLISYTISTTLTFVLLLLAMAFFTLLERKILGYIQIRKGPSKVGIMGLPQPFADALKLFLKEQGHPSMTNYTPFYFAPIMSLLLALMMWSLYPSMTPSLLFPFGVLFFLAISSMSVYSTLVAGWSSNSKYSLIGALRSVAQTISYEVSMSLILLTALLCLNTYNFFYISFNSYTWAAMLLAPMFFVWFITMLAETNRTPFDLAEGESELVSGFNTEYSSGPFALIFMAEYLSILAMSMFSVALFSSSTMGPILSDFFFSVKTLFIASCFIWVRGTLPRMRYDLLMSLTWKTFLPAVLSLIMLMLATIMLI